MKRQSTPEQPPFRDRSRDGRRLRAGLGAEVPLAGRHRM
ncbi:hypothetical protein N177_0698 [Lutibaculum baratangense AMV1]|uniref:Uncharacterized protein n=1 Tax=Lutibaculum baratangense AMV1 TaxID=631454 RepID=V4RNU7_9HYPH|nr:hypothetical protein N177_0698 [Lutibaculum baratangense AMV1]